MNDAAIVFWMSATTASTACCAYLLYRVLIDERPVKDDSAETDNSDDA